MHDVRPHVGLGVARYLEWFDRNEGGENPDIKGRILEAYGYLDEMDQEVDGFAEASIPRLRAMSRLGEEVEQFWEDLMARYGLSESVQTQNYVYLRLQGQERKAQEVIKEFEAATSL